MNCSKLREIFENETNYKAIGKNGTYHSKYGKWLEDRLVKNYSIPDVVGRFYTDDEIKEIKETEYKKGLYFEGY